MTRETCKNEKNKMKETIISAIIPRQFQQKILRFSKGKPTKK